LQHVLHISGERGCWSQTYFRVREAQAEFAQQCYKIWSGEGIEFQKEETYLINMMYNIQDHWVFGLHPSSCILKNTKEHNVSERGFVSIFR
jgi:hypothetical protein